MDVDDWPLPRSDRRLCRSYHLAGANLSDLPSALGKRGRDGSGPITQRFRASNRVVRFPSNGPRITAQRVDPRNMYARPDTATRGGSGHIDYGSAGMSGAVGRLVRRSSGVSAGRYRTSSMGRSYPPYTQRRGYKRLLSGVRFSSPLRGFLGPAGDLKFKDVAFFASVFNTTGAVSHLDVIPTGTTVNTREGKAYQVLSCQIRGNAQSGTTTAVALGAIYLIWDFQPNKALAAVTDILDTASANSFIKRENASRFKILMQRHYSFTGLLGTPATGNEQFAVEEFVRIPASSSVATTTVADTTGVIGNRVSGALLMVTVGDTAAGTAAPNYEVGLRINFRDI